MTPARTAPGACLRQVLTTVNSTISRCSPQRFSRVAPSRGTETPGELRLRDDCSASGHGMRGLPTRCPIVPSISPWPSAKRSPTPSNTPIRSRRAISFFASPRATEEYLGEVQDLGTWREAAVEPDRGRGLEILAAITRRFEVNRTASGTTVAFAVALDPHFARSAKAQSRFASAISSGERQGYVEQTRAAYQHAGSARARDRDVEAIALEEKLHVARHVVAARRCHRIEDDGGLLALELVDGADAKRSTPAHRAACARSTGAVRCTA